MVEGAAQITPPGLQTLYNNVRCRWCGATRTSGAWRWRGRRAPSCSPQVRGLACVGHSALCCQLNEGAHKLESFLTPAPGCCLAPPGSANGVPVRLVDPFTSGSIYGGGGSYTFLATSEFLRQPPAGNESLLIDSVNVNGLQCTLALPAGASGGSSGAEPEGCRLTGLPGPALAAAAGAGNGSANGTGYDAAAALSGLGDVAGLSSSSCHATFCCGMVLLSPSAPPSPPPSVSPNPAVAPSQSRGQGQQPPQQQSPAPLVSEASGGSDADGSGGLPAVQPGSGGRNSSSGDTGSSPPADTNGNGASTSVNGNNSSGALPIPAAARRDGAGAGASPAAQQQGSSNSSSSVGLVAGAAAGGTAAAAAALLGGWWLLRHRRRLRLHNQSFKLGQAAAAAAVVGQGSSKTVCAASPEMGVATLVGPGEGLSSTALVRHCFCV